MSDEPDVKLTWRERLDDWWWNLRHWRALRRHARWYRDTPEPQQLAVALHRRRAQLRRLVDMGAPKFVITKQIELIEKAKTRLHELGFKER